MDIREHLVHDAKDADTPPAKTRSKTVSTQEPNKFKENHTGVKNARCKTKKGSYSCNNFELVKVIQDNFVFFLHRHGLKSKSR